MVAGAACATAPTTVSARLDDPDGACAADGDCEVTTFAGCCAMCPRAPYPINRTALQRQTDVCTVVECACTGSCRSDCARSEDPAIFRAACVARRCTAVRR
jgi:hypothetical protein